MSGHGHLAQEMCRWLASRGAATQMPPKSASLVATFGLDKIVLQMYGVQTLHDVSRQEMVSATLQALPSEPKPSRRGAASSRSKKKRSRIARPAISSSPNMPGMIRKVVGEKALRPRRECRKPSLPSYNLSDITWRKPANRRHQSHRDPVETAKSKVSQPSGARHERFQLLGRLRMSLYFSRILAGVEDGPLRTWAARQCSTLLTQHVLAVCNKVFEYLPEFS